MPATDRREIRQAFGNFSYGTNLADDACDIADAQVKYSLNAILVKNGFYKRRGFKALALTWTGEFQGVYEHTFIDGSTVLLVVNNGNLFSVDTTTPSKTLLYTIGSLGKASFASSIGRCFVATGGTLVKVEKDSYGVHAYRVGIVAPDTGSSAASAGGTLPDGVYHVYIGYARKVGGSNVLYSKPHQLSDVTISVGNKSVTITSFSNSSDYQVNNKIVWMSRAGLADIYFAHETNDNTTTSITISSDTTNDNIRMDVSAVPNDVPDDFDYVYAFNGRIWGSVDNVVSYSYQNTGNPYDLEKFYVLNKNTYQYRCDGFFSLAENLYINTRRGIITIPKGQAYSQQIYNDGLHWYDVNTVCQYSGKLIGLTDIGVRYFDGESFSDSDLGEKIRSEVMKIYSSTSGYSPCAVVIPRALELTVSRNTVSRYEYHIGYNDDTISVSNNNKQIVLNLEGIARLDSGMVVAPWEIWNIGFNYACLTSGNTAVYCQNHAASQCVLFLEVFDSTVDNGVYDSSGNVCTSKPVETIVETKVKRYPLDSITTWTHACVKSMSSINTHFKICFDDLDSYDENVVSASLDGINPFSWDIEGAGWDEGHWEAFYPVISKHVIGQYGLGNSLYVRIECTGDDVKYNFNSIELYGINNRNMLLW